MVGNAPRGNVPRYVSPRQAAENRAGLRAHVVTFLFWTAVLVPVVFALMIYGYSDQSPGLLRKFTFALDEAVGSPVWKFLKAMTAR